MPDLELTVWLHTRSTLRDYRWITRASSEFPLPIGESGVLSRLAIPDARCTPIMAFLDHTGSLLLACGRAADRRDEHRRRIHDHMVLKLHPAEGLLASEISALAKAVLASKTGQLTARVAQDELSVEQFEEYLRDLCAHAIATASGKGLPQLPSAVVPFLRDEKCVLAVRSGLTFDEVCALAFGAGGPFSSGLLIGAAIDNPTLLADTGAVVSSRAPLLQWNATNGQFILFSQSGERFVGRADEISSMMSAASSGLADLKSSNKSFVGRHLPQPIRNWLERKS